MRESKVLAALESAWESEIEAAQLYRALAELQESPHRKHLFERLAQSEEKHASEFAARISDLGGTPPIASDTLPTTAQRLMARTIGTDAMLRRMEAEEERNTALFEKRAEEIADDHETSALFKRIEEEEQQHASQLHSMKSHDEPRTRLDALMKAEKWHVNTGSWIGDSIYGINDGLGAVFGVVGGMAGYNNDTKLVLVSGLFTLLASALSMGSSAFMASKSEREVYQAELDRERHEIEQSPEHEMEELELLYQLKGFSESEAKMMTQRIAADPEQFLKTMAQEELGLSERHFPNPWTGAVSAAISTAVGGVIPVLPFLFIGGMRAVIASAIVSLLAHFLVGAAKSLITARNWIASGFEMTFIGLLSGGVTYGIGYLFKHV